MNNNKKLIKEIKKVLLSIINKKSLSHNFGPSTEEIRECLKRINLILNSPDELIIDVFKKDIDWNYISVYLKLSEYFINYFYDKVEWWNISVHQKLSEKFIEKFQDKVQWEFIINNQKLSQEFIFKFWDTKLSKLKGKVLVLHKKVITPEFVLWLYKTYQDEEYKLIKEITSNTDLFQYCIMIESQVSRVLIEYNQNG